MPTYQYRCKACGHDLEVVQSFTDDPLDTCPECQGALKKVYGNVGISFKGSGFYKTDSRGKSTSSKTKTDAKADTKSDSGASKSGDSGSGDSSSSKKSESSGGDKTASSTASGSGSTSSS